MLFMHGCLLIKLGPWELYEQKIMSFFLLNFVPFLFIQIPVALLISQCQKEADGSSGLLRFSEVVSLFHEFGHVVCLLLLPLNMIS